MGLPDRSRDEPLALKAERAPHFAFRATSAKCRSVKATVSLPWSGSVNAQQLEHSGARPAARRLTSNVARVLSSSADEGLRHARATP